MELLQSWLSSLTHYILTFLKFPFFRVKAEPKSHLLFLPPEILLQILNYLDYRALIDTRQTCKALYGMLNCKRFWANLARDLCSTPGIGKLAYPFGDYSTTELMHWTLRRLHTRDCWVSDDVSQPLRFRSQLFDGGSLFGEAEFIRGGRWLFTIQVDGATHIIDLGQTPPKRHFLFDTYGPQADYLLKFRIWVDETKQEFSFRVATYQWETARKKTTRICIHQVDSVEQGSSFTITPITTIKDYPRTTIRTCTALSDKYFLQSFAVRDEVGRLVGPRPVVVIQLRRYSQDSSSFSLGFTEKNVYCKGITSVFFLPDDRVGFVAPKFMKIYAISSEQDTVPAELVLLHHVPTRHSPSLLSVPFVGSNYTYLVGAYKDTFRRITFDHNYNSPPTIQELGNLKPVEKRPIQLGPAASVIYRSQRFLEVITYERFEDRDCFQCKSYDIPQDHPAIPTIGFVAFDDSTGRIVLRTRGPQGQLLLLDVI